MQDAWVRSLGQEDPLEKEMATQSSISCLGNPMDRGPWQGYSYSLWGRKRIGYNLATKQQQKVLRAVNH